MSDFLTTGEAGSLTDKLSEGLNRIESYQNISRGIDTRSGNIILTDNKNKRRAYIGTLKDGDFVIAISAENLDVLNELGL